MADYAGFHKSSPPPRTARSIRISFDGAEVDTYEIVRQSPVEAIEHAVEHVRFMVKVGAWAPGNYRFAEIGTNRKRDVKLTGPKRAA